MSTFWQQLITLILTPTIVVAVITYISRGIFQQLLSRDMENYKQKLQADFEVHKLKLQSEQEQAKLQLENELQKRLHEFQTKFSSYHTKQAEVIGQIYELLMDASDYVADMILVGPSSDVEKQKELEREVKDLVMKLTRFYRKNRIFLNKESCGKMDGLLKKINFSFSTFVFARITPSQDRIKIWLHASEIMEKEVPPLLDELENQFRSNLSLP
jgi:hypothetical protein